MGNFIMISQFVLSLTILVILHECGHFFPARWFKTRVEKFYLFFDPYFSLFKKKIGETEYGIGWLPLGGYVKISGMVDESFDTAQLQSEPKPWEFRSKPAWQRLIIMVGGVTVNFILGFFIFAMLFWKNGVDYIPMAELKYGISVDSIAYEMGFRDGDQILNVGDLKPERFETNKIIKTLLLEENSTIEILRDGQTLTLDVPWDKRSILAKPEMKNYPFMGVRTPAVIDSIFPGSGAEMAGLQKGDKVFEVNGQTIGFAHELAKVTKRAADASFRLGVLRNVDTLYVDAGSDKNGTIGILWPQVKIENEKFGFFESLPKGVVAGVDLLTTQLKAFRQMGSGNIKAKDSLGGFASIAKMFDKTWDWTAFWRMTAVLSIILGFMNLLPIPALDGGYVVFLMIEVITGKKVPDKIVEKATLIGFIILLALLLYANGLDVFRAFGK